MPEGAGSQVSNCWCASRVQGEWCALLSGGMPCHAAAVTCLPVQAASGCAAFAQPSAPACTCVVDVTRMLAAPACTCVVDVTSMLAAPACNTARLLAAHRACSVTCPHPVRPLSSHLSMMPQQTSGSVPPCPAVSGKLSPIPLRRLGPTWCLRCSLRPAVVQAQTHVEPGAPVPRRQASSREASTSVSGQTAESGSPAAEKPSPEAILADLMRRLGWTQPAAPPQVSDEQQMVQAAKGNDKVADGSEV